MPADETSFTVNGDSVAAPPDAVLLDVLRDALGLRSPKDGCRPQGQCGCCTVLVDGEPRVACVTPVRRVSGRAVVTLEGLPGEERARWAAAFASARALQCGFCTPGIVARLVGLSARYPNADDVRLDRALAAHVCRCTGWLPIREAFRIVRRPAGDGPPELGELALGDRPFVADLTGGADVARLRVVRAGRSGWLRGITHAPTAGLIRLAAGDVPGLLAAVGDRCAPGTAVLAFAGSPAAVGAVEVRVDVEPATPPPPEMSWALPEPALPSSGTARAEVHLDAADHASLEPPTWLADANHLWTSSSGPGVEAAWLDALGLPQQVTPVAAGGAFGGRDPLPDGALAAYAAHLLGQPVLAALDRTEAITATPKRRRWRAAAAAAVGPAGLSVVWHGRVDAAPAPGPDRALATARDALLGLPYRGVAGGRLERGYDSPFAPGGYRAEGWLPVVLAVELVLDQLLDDPITDRLGLLREPLGRDVLHALGLHEPTGWAVACAAPALPTQRVRIRVRRTPRGLVVAVPVGESGQGALRLLDEVLAPAGRAEADPMSTGAAPGCGPALAAALSALDPADLPDYLETEVPPPAPAAAAVRLEGDAVAEVRVALAAGPIFDVDAARARAVGAAHMGLGAALSEGVETRSDGTVRSTTLRHLGVIRAADTPTIDVRFVSGGPSRGVGAGAFAAACCAMAVALHRLRPDAPLRLPARESPPGRRLRRGT